MAIPVRRCGLPRGAWVTIGSLVAVHFLGCAATSWDRVAPPVGTLALAGVGGMPDWEEALERGRMVYLQDCSQCHVPEPILAYSIEEWGRILPEMIEETVLTASQEADLRLYVESVLELELQG
ncbi:MAG: hypothetical protein P8J59_05310 [Phycisphaerales bacterium]|jgi:hypothetical protein|nr:hypothetical protein [Phycisphaerales bacterium]